MTISFNIDPISNNSDTSVKLNPDVVIIGGGPAGLTAAIYNSRAGMNVLMIEKLAAGGQIFITAEVENYPGIDVISGPELSIAMENQARKFGTRIEYDEVEKIIDGPNEYKTVHTTSGKQYKTKAIIISTGAKYKSIGVPGEELFRGKGVSNCATCDGAFYKNMEIAVIGGGETAVEEAEYLTRFASKVHIIHRRDRLRATKSAQDKALKNPKINLIFDSVLEEIAGVSGVDKIKIVNTKTGAKSELAVKGVFVFVGLVPNTNFLKGYVDLDAQGYIKTDASMNTSRPGVFACGDCIVKELRQVVTATGDGAVASYTAQHYIDKMNGQEYI
ncbi:MAG: thioredoxin-disulfide reductase [bacterium]